MVHHQGLLLQVLSTYLNLQVLIVPILGWPLVIDVSVHPGYTGGPLITAPVGLAVPCHDGVVAVLPLPHSTSKDTIMSESSE
jgi:hypothetical protein